jgi:hypothetical protein
VASLLHCRYRDCHLRSMITCAQANWQLVGTATKNDNTIGKRDHEIFVPNALTCIYVGFEVRERKRKKTPLPVVPHKVIECNRSECGARTPTGVLRLGATWSCGQGQASSFRQQCQCFYTARYLPSFQSHTHFRCGGKVMVARHECNSL